jgi:hypothetical protein
MSRQQIATLKACEADRASREITEDLSWSSEFDVQIAFLNIAEYDLPE